jgi:hypothetical protein
VSRKVSEDSNDEPSPRAATGALSRDCLLSFVCSCRCFSDNGFQRSASASSPGKRMPEKPHGMKGVMDHRSFLKRLKIIAIFNRHVKQKFD